MRFIVIDGLDAAGKDTHAKIIKKRYERRGEDVLLRSHPSSDNLFGEKAEKALLGKGKISRAKAALYFLLDVLNSFLTDHRSYDTVIFVRYLCGVAYLPAPLSKIFYKLFSSILPFSDYMFFLDVKPEDALERIENRNNRQLFENGKALKETRKKALSIVQDWHVINTSRPINESHAEIDRILDKIDEKNGMRKESEIEIPDSSDTTTT